MPPKPAIHYTIALPPILYDRIKMRAMGADLSIAETMRRLMTAAILDNAPLLYHNPEEL